MNISKDLQRPKRCLSIIAPAKINLHLEILGLRSDGFHELAMVMQSIDLFDQIDIYKNSEGLINLESDSEELSMDEDNLIIRAAKLLRKKSNKKDLGASLYLHKRIPIGAGLAGGSSDCAATLMGLNEFWDLGYEKSVLEEFSSELGSDIPFCFSGGTQLCFGRGEKLEQIEQIGLPMAILLVKDPNSSVSTPWAYSKFREINEFKYLITEKQFEEKRNALRSKPWLKSLGKGSKPDLVNNLQEVVAPLTPSLENALYRLSNLPGAISVAMSGSGPSCFALYSHFEKAQEDYDAFHKKFEEVGLEVWCCSCLNEGVSIYS